MISSFVIDASVIVSWYSTDEQNDYAGVSVFVKTEFDGKFRD
jgi:predicted nucleic acid-binding protein